MNRYDDERKTLWKIFGLIALRVAAAVALGAIRVDASALDAGVDILDAAAVALWWSAIACGTEHDAGRLCERS